MGAVCCPSIFLQLPPTEILTQVATIFTSLSGMTMTLRTVFPSTWGWTFASPRASGHRLGGSLEEECHRLQHGPDVDGSNLSLGSLDLLAERLAGECQVDSLLHQRRGRHQLNQHALELAYAAPYGFDQQVQAGAGATGAFGVRVVARGWWGVAGGVDGIVEHEVHAGADTAGIILEGCDVEVEDAAGVGRWDGEAHAIDIAVCEVGVVDAA